jgi:hypothetical protein
MAQALIKNKSNQKRNLFSEPELKQLLTIAYQQPEPESIRFLENTPNPFNPVTTVQFSVTIKEFVSVKVINPLGREVCTLFSEVAVPNKIYEAVFDGLRLPSAVYFCLLQIRRERKIIRMVLLK